MPQVIAPVILSAWGAVVTSMPLWAPALATAIAKVAITAGAYMYQRQQTKKALRALGGSTNLDTGRMISVREAAATRKLLYGQLRIGGTVVYLESSGTTNEYLHAVIALVDHECEEIGDIYFNDEIVPLDGSGNATGKYAGYVRVKKHLGADSQTVDTDLQTDVTSALWSNDHRLRGIAYIYVRLTHNPDLFPSGIPNITAVCKGFQVYDPRDASTAWSANSALALRHYMLLSADRCGFGADSAEIDDDATEAAANISDEAVNLNPSGTEARYAANVLIDTASEPGVIIAGFCSSMAGICPYVGGEFKMKAGAHTASVLTITEDNVRGGVNFSTRDSLRQAFNGVKGTYVSAKTDYQPADFPPVVNATYTTEDGGTRIWRDLSLGFTTSSSMAQRLAKIELERGRQDITVTLKTSLMPIEAHAGDVVALTLARYGWSAKLFEIVDCKFYVEGGENPILGLEWTLRETASGVWDWSSGEETTVDLAPNTTLPDPYTVATPATPTLSTSNFQQPDGATTPRLKVVITPPGDVKVTTGGFTEVEYKKTADSTWLVWNPALRGNATEDYITDVLAGISYDVRLRFRNIHHVRSAYSATAAHTLGGDTTAPAAPTGLAAVTGTGKSVSLDWDDSTEDDLSEYAVYRHTANDPGASTKIAEVRASRFVDVDVTLATTYYYWVTAIDRSENESAKSSGVSATPSVIAGTSVDSTPPSTPSAPTYVSEAVYLSGDGTVFARVTVAAPALPTGAVANNVLYRRSGASSWLIGSQETAAGNVSIDDLSPVIAYEFAVQAVSFSGVLSAISSTLSRTTPGDTSAPSAPTGLAAVTGTGKSVSLDWADSTEDDLSEYAVYRHTANDPGASTKIAETRASRFVDVDVTLATTYYYWVTAIDRSENESAKSSGVSATPAVVAGTSVDSTAPSTPSAPTYVSETTYQSGDGNTFARVTVAAPALPTGAVANNILYRRSGASSWLIGSQETAAGNVSIDDLSPVIAYEFAVQAVSFSGALSAVSSTLSRTTPGDTTAPSAPASINAYDELGGVRVTWATVTAADLRGYILYRYTSNSFGSASEITRITGTTYIDRDVAYGTTYYYWVKAIDTSGNASSEYGPAFSPPGKVAAADLSDGAVTTIKLANGSVSTVVAVEESTVVGITNGSYTEVADIAVSVAAGQDVVIDFNFGYSDSSPNTTGFYMRIKRDGTVIWSEDYTTRAGVTDRVAAGTVDADLASSVSAYTLEIQPNGGGGTATPTINTPNLRAIILKDREN